MQWSELWNKEHEPSDAQIKEYVETPLWQDLTDYLQQTYHVKPKLFYSRCSMENGFWKGWNVKYQKSGKSLCTLYPKQGYYAALINVGPKEATEAEFLLPLCTEYTQDLYKHAKSGTTGKSLGICVTSEDVLNDVKELVALRANSH